MTILSQKLLGKVGPRIAAWPKASFGCILIPSFRGTMSPSVPLAGVDMRSFKVEFSPRPSSSTSQLSVSRRSARLARQSLSATTSAAAAAVAEPALRYAGDAANQSAGSASPAVASESTGDVSACSSVKRRCLSLGVSFQALRSPRAMGEVLCNLITEAHLHSSGRLLRLRPGGMR